MKRPFSSLTTLVIGAIIFASLYVFFTAGSAREIPEVPFSLVAREYADNQVEKVRREGNTLLVTLKNREQQRTYVEASADLKTLGFDPTKVQIEIVDTQKAKVWSDLLSAIIPVLLIVGFLFFMMRQAQSSNNSALSFGKSRARLYSREKEGTRFTDVAGNHEAKAELVEVVDFLKNPKKYTSMGAKIPRGVMLFGPPGTGKTLLAKAVAGEAQVPFYSISGSEFVEMFVGVGASRVRDLFQRAKRNAPCIIFVDEIDAVGRQRGTGIGGGHDEREQTLNQILVEMDGFDTDTNVIVMAATNRPDVLDPALLRPGRFDRRVIIDLPSLSDRDEILKVHARGKPLAKEVDLMRLAKITAGFSGADLQNLVNESAIAAAAKNARQIGMDDLTNSIEKVVMGPERKSRVMTKLDKEITAYHEAGHAIVSKVLPNSHPVHKITIISRGMSLGATWFLPEDDKHLQSKAFFRDDLAAALGGRVAEEMIFGEEKITTGASNDIAKATEIARRMVTEFGMSPLGPVAYASPHGMMFLGRGGADPRDYSEETARAIDVEVTKILTEAHERARATLTEYASTLHAIAKVLMEKETIEGDEFDAFFPATVRAAAKRRAPAKRKA